MTPLDRLCALAGIETGYADGLGAWRVVPETSRRAILAALGFPAADDDAVARSLASAATAPWRRAAPEVLVARSGAPLVVPLHLREGLEKIAWRLAFEDGGATEGGGRAADLALLEGGVVDGVALERRALALPQSLPEGYHLLTVEGAAGDGAGTRLIVAPRSCFVPEAVAGERRAWGLAVQLYGLRSAEDWGIGDFGALAELAAGIGRLGGAAVGLSPLHALFPDRPERFSPYAASSRLALNILHIDLAAVPEFAELPAVAARAASLRGLDLIDYPAAAKLKRGALEALYDGFRRRHLEAGETARGRAFRAFQTAEGETLRLHALFEALAEAMRARGPGWWRAWPAEFRHPAAPGVAAFAARERRRVEFFAFAQWLAATQLAAAAERGRAAGLGIGLYRDLAVGVAADGAEAWAFQDALAPGISLGAPPDRLGPLGQDWGVPPFNPRALAVDGYAAFAAVLRQNMRSAGALRLDHALGLNRQFWVPAGRQASEGGYVRMPLEDLLGVIALESRRNRCLVVGEDLGTVPPGFSERLQAEGLLSTRVLYFERDGVAFRPPAAWPRDAAAMVATHDLPTLRGFWTGRDIALRRDLGLFPAPETEREAEEERARDREHLVAALVALGLLPAGTRVEAIDPGALALAAHAFLADTPCRLAIAQAEDVLGEVEQANLPGTVEQHPNWRRRLKLAVAALLGEPRLAALAAAMRERGRGT